MKRVIVAPCPNCSSDTEYIYQTESIPYFPDILISSAVCDCGFKSVDVQIMGDSDPVRYTLSVESAEDLSVKVIRSTGGSIEIPEFGILVEPGPICEGFITNVEGVLYRFENTIEGILTWAEDEQRENAGKLLDTLRKARGGEIPFTLIVQDDCGNSGIVSDKAVKSDYIPYEHED